MDACKALALTFLTATLLASSASAEVRLTIREGRVSLVATDATIRQILTEWARVGQTKLVNVERLAGAPVTLQLTNVTEEEALDVLLRSTSGYIAAPREAAASNVSRFDRIIVMPPSVAPRAIAAAPSASPTVQPPTFPQISGVVGQPGQPGGTVIPGVPQGVPDDDGDDGRPAPTVTVPPNRGPVFTFPQPQIVPQGVPQGTAPAGVLSIPSGVGGVPAQSETAPPPTTVYPSAPTAPAGGVARPGMIVPTPQPVQPGAPPPPNAQGQ